MMTQMRAVGAQALAPNRGNISNQENAAPAIDNSKLLKRRSCPVYISQNIGIP